jgi:hypothetical protein
MSECLLEFSPEEAYRSLQRGLDCVTKAVENECADESVSLGVRRLTPNTKYRHLHQIVQIVNIIHFHFCISVESI